MGNALRPKDVDVLWEVRRAFEREFGPVLYKFDFVALNLDSAVALNTRRVWNPGVYVWMAGPEIIKVGRSLSNARKRALEHLQDNTGGTMAGLKDNPNSLLVLITVEPEDRHWAAALEIYLEEKLNPSIKSQREG